MRGVSGGAAAVAGRWRVVGRAAAAAGRWRGSGGGRAVVAGQRRGGGAYTTTLVWIRKDNYEPPLKRK